VASENADFPTWMRDASCLSPAFFPSPTPIHGIQIEHYIIDIVVQTIPIHDWPDGWLDKWLDGWLDEGVVHPVISVILGGEAEL
jgi:hypothetical protein